MTSRLLPATEWPRLAGTELETVWRHLPESARVIVVEDDGGQIVGCWSLFTSVHVEGVWVHPDYRGKSSVARRLLVMMRHQARELGAVAVITGALTAQVRRLIKGLGGTRVPGAQYVIPLER